jgi:asparagine synthase (glutamine-hydrolysing)
VLDPLSASVQVDTRYPFWDRRLVEFCLALPSDQKLRNGWGRFVLREAMRGRLPESVRLRATKADFLPFLREDMMQEKKQLHSLLFSPLEGGKEYVGETEIQDIWCMLCESEESRRRPRDVFAIWTAAVFMHWLRRRDDFTDAESEGLRPDLETTSTV